MSTKKKTAVPHPIELDPRTLTPTTRKKRQPITYEFECTFAPVRPEREAAYYAAIKYLLRLMREDFFKKNPHLLEEANQIHAEVK